MIINTLVDNKMFKVNLRWVEPPRITITQPSSTSLNYLASLTLQILVTANAALTINNSNPDYFEVSYTNDVVTVTTTSMNLSTNQISTTILFVATLNGLTTTEEITITQSAAVAVPSNFLNNTIANAKKDSTKITFNVVTPYPVSVTTDSYVTAYSVDINGYSANNTSRQVTLTLNTANFVKGNHVITITTGYPGNYKTLTFTIVCKVTNIYGVYIDATSSDPAVTRIATDMTLHATLPVHNAMGTATYYSQLFVKLPAFYLGIQTTSNNSQYIVISLNSFSEDDMKNLTGDSSTPTITPMPIRYVGKYEGYRDTNDSGRMLSVPGYYPTCDVAGTNFLTYCNNTGASCHMLTSSVQCTIEILFLIEYATRNSQATYNSSLTSEGYHLGGLGTGPTTLSEISTNTFTSDNKTTGGNGKQIVYRGIVNPFGNCFKELVDIYQKNGAIYVASSKSRWNRNSDPAYYSTGLRNVASSGYIKTINYCFYNGVLFKLIIAVGGSSSTYWCDYYLYSSGTIGYFIGGDYTNGSYAGLWYSNAIFSVGYSGFDIGCRLTYLPNDPV